MHNGPNAQPEGSGIEDEVRAAVEDDAIDVRDTVRRVTVQALSGAPLDMATMRRVMKAVVQGARTGAARGGDRGRQKLSDAIRGLDEALAAAAQATQLAVQEAVGRTADFSRYELSRALDDLNDLESQFVATLSAAAGDAGDVAAATLRDLAEHARRGGTAIGHRMTSILTQLGETMAAAAKQRTDAGLQGVRESSAALANLAAGFLGGIAEHLNRPGGDRSHDDSPGLARENECCGKH